MKIFFLDSLHAEISLDVFMFWPISSSLSIVAGEKGQSTSLTRCMLQDIFSPDKEEILYRVARA